MTVGPPAAPLGLIRVAPPPYSLLRVPGVLLTQGERQTIGRWLNGVQIEPEPCDLPLDVTAEGTDYPYWWECAETGGQSAAAALETMGGIKNIGAAEAILEGDAITLWAGYTCRAFDLGTDYAREIEARALRKLAALTPVAVEHELWTGNVANLAAFDNPALNDAGTVTELNGGSATGFVTALAELEQALADTAPLFGQRIIHAQPRVVSVWASRDLVERSADNSYLTTKLGTFVVPGVGYPGTNSDGDLPDQNVSYAYGTGMVRVLLTDPQIRADTSSVERSLNDAEIRAELDALILFDPCAHVGISVALCDEYCNVGI